MTNVRDVAQHVELSESEVVQHAMRLGSSTLYEANGQRGALPNVIRCMTPGRHVAGRALTVQSPGGDNLWLHRALSVAGPGHVIVATVGGSYDFGYWGEILSWGARARGVGGVVIDGCVRDIDRLAEIGVPVFARGACIRGTRKDVRGKGNVNAPVHLDDVVVHPGDLIVGDNDGLVVVPAPEVGSAIVSGSARTEEEARVISLLIAGRSTVEIYDLPQGDAWQTPGTPL